jgi:hypothetical protein
MTQGLRGRELNGSILGFNSATKDFMEESKFNIK